MLETAHKSFAADARSQRQRSAIGGRVGSNRSATTNDPMRARANGRTAGGRRVRDLFKAYLAAMGRTDDIACAQALAAAELTVAAENGRAELLAGQGDVEQIVRLENLANRAVKRLGLKPGAPRDSEPNLASYLASLAAREPAEVPEEAEPEDGEEAPAESSDDDGATA